MFRADILWLANGPTLKMERGTCYWINPLIRTTARSG